jgi:hypothetical protein
MTWYLDGNNLLGALGLRGPGDARVLLVNRLLRMRLPRPCVLVFDGPPASEVASASGGAGLRVLFSGARSADDLIAERLRPGDKVVTRDRELGLRARDRRGRPVAPAEFFSDLRPARRTPDGEKPEPGSDLDEWMRIFGGGDP